MSKQSVKYIHLPRFIFFAMMGFILLLTISNLYFLYQNLERSRVLFVVDGDSFQLADGRRIRLLAIDSPERGRCGFDEARTHMQELVDKKVVKLTDSITDDYGRILANVWVGETLVNKSMVDGGFARFIYVNSPQYESLKQSNQLAKSQKLGIYSSTCLSAVSETNCDIKGNIRSGEKIYHLPACRNYTNVIIDTAFGDRWFCTEDEATREGFHKVKNC